MRIKPRPFAREWRYMTKYKSPRMSFEPRYPRTELAFTEVVSHHNHIFLLNRDDVGFEFFFHCHHKYISNLSTQRKLRHTLTALINSTFYDTSYTKHRSVFLYKFNNIFKSQGHYVFMFLLIFFFLMMMNDICLIFKEKSI